MGVDVLPEKVKKKMATDIKIFIAVCIIVALIIGASVVYILTPKNIAVVKDNKITNAEFTYYFTQNFQQYYSLFGGQVDQQTLVELVKQQSLTQTVEIEYLLQEAGKEGFTVSKEDMDAAWNEVDSILKANAEVYGVSVDTLCRQYFGVKYNQAKSIYQENTKAQKYLEKLINDMQIDEEELKAYYEENKSSLDYNTVSHILILCDKNAEDSVVEEKKNTAQSILDRVNNGEDFAELAKEYSEDPGSAEAGGQYDVKRGQMVQEFEEWTFSHKVGDTGLIRTDYGFHVMRLDGVHDNFDSVKDSIKDMFKMNKYQTALQEALENGEYKVEVKDAYYEFTGI